MKVGILDSQDEIRSVLGWLGWLWSAWKIVARWERYNRFSAVVLGRSSGSRLGQLQSLERWNRVLCESIVRVSPFPPILGHVLPVMGISKVESSPLFPSGGYLLGNRDLSLSSLTCFDNRSSNLPDSGSNLSESSSSDHPPDHPPGET